MDDAPAHYDSIYRPRLFADSRALVTGGGTGIGRAIAHELAALGAEVVLAARRLEKLEEVAAEIAAAGGTAHVTELNIRDADAVEEAVTQIVDDLGPIDLLVNNAGGQFPSPAEAISPNGWRTVVDLNLNGTFFVSRAAFNACMGERGGAIVTIAADMWNGFPGMAHTGAARAGVVNLTKTLAVEWGGRGVRVNAVAPGLIFSSGMATYDDAFLEVAMTAGSRIPAGRVGTESETAAATLFLLSPAASFITGETLRVDGGSSLAKVPMLPLEPHERTPRYDGFHLARDIPDGWSGGESS